MLRFLRKIRKKLIESGSARKYILYAIGEIALVVIGILIALQVNNWNVNQQKRSQERQLLEEFQIALQEDIEDLNRINSIADRLIRSLEHVIESLQRSHPLDDSLRQDFTMIAMATVVFSPRNGPYETLKSFGFDLVTNDSLRKSISAIYDYDYPRYEKVSSDFLTRVEDWELFLREEINFQGFEAIGSPDLEPFDYQRLHNNERVLSLLYRKLLSVNTNRYVLDGLKNRLVQVENQIRLALEDS